MHRTTSSRLGYLPCDRREMDTNDGCLHCPHIDATRNNGRDGTCPGYDSQMHRRGCSGRGVHSGGGGEREQPEDAAHSARTEIVELEDEWARAIVSNDPERFKVFTTDDWVIVSDSGVTTRLQGQIASGRRVDH